MINNAVDGFLLEVLNNLKDLLYASTTIAIYFLSMKPTACLCASMTEMIGKC